MVHLDFQSSSTFNQVLSKGSETHVITRSSTLSALCSALAYSGWSKVFLSLTASYKRIDNTNLFCRLCWWYSLRYKCFFQKRGRGKTENRDQISIFHLWSSLKKKNLLTVLVKIGSRMRSPPIELPLRTIFLKSRFLLVNSHAPASWGFGANWAHIRAPGIELTLENHFSENSTFIGSQPYPPPLRFPGQWSSYSSSRHRINPSEPFFVKNRFLFVNSLTLPAPQTLPWGFRPMELIFGLPDPDFLYRGSHDGET